MRRISRSFFKRAYSTFQTKAQKTFLDETNIRLAPFWNVVAGGRETADARNIINIFQRAGFTNRIKPKDPRISETMTALDRAVLENRPIDRIEFENLISPCVVLFSNAVSKCTTIPDFDEFTEDITRIYEEVRDMPHGGKVADYIPELSEADPDAFAVSVCTIDGQRLSLGDHQTKFCLQSTSKAISYLMALEEYGSTELHDRVWFEPSGQAFNDLTLRKFMDGRLRPHNPMINAGAIMCCAHIRPHLPNSKRFSTVMRVCEKLSGSSVSFNNAVFLSEKETAHRNRCLAHMMMEHHCFPDNTNIEHTLDFYFQTCAIEITPDDLAVMGATLANSGLNPLHPESERVFKPEHIKYCMSLMLSCGMYDFSGEWAFQVGVPAKSGVSGNILMVLPNKMAFSIFSPPLDALGNSYKGIEFAKRLLQVFNFHHLETNLDFVGESTQVAVKKNPMKKRMQAKSNLITDLNFAAAAGDTNELRRLEALGVNLFIGDYDSRTALHLACSEGHTGTAAFLIQKAKTTEQLMVEDRWNNTPMEDAVREGQTDIIELLETRLDELNVAEPDIVKDSEIEDLESTRSTE